MTIPRPFFQNEPTLKGLVEEYHLHTQLRPVSLDKMLETLKIRVRLSQFADPWFEGFSLYNQDGLIVVNEANTPAIQRKVKGHELIHLLWHTSELPLFSNPLFSNKLMEKEANYGAAYLLVPAWAFTLAEENELTMHDLAAGLEVPVDLVLKRFEIYLSQKDK